jgi:ABC-type ATPase involved in cell division
MIELVDVQVSQQPNQPGREGWSQRGSFSVPSGGVGVVIAGAGAGSSQLIRALCGEVAIAAGTTGLFGYNTQTLRRNSLRSLRRRIGLLPQQLELLGELTAHDNVALPLEIDGMARGKALAAAWVALDEMGLANETALVAQLPASVQQRVAFARAIVRKPEALLLDQPTSMQDPEGAAMVCAAVGRAAERGAAVLVVTRDGAMRDAAERHRWQQWFLAGGSLHSANEVALDAATIETLLVNIESSPVRATRERSVPTVVRLPISGPIASAT